MTSTHRLSRLSLHGAFSLLLVILALRTLRTPMTEFGDGREYVLQTQALVFDRHLAIDPTQRAAYWNETNPFGVQLNPNPKALPDEDSTGEQRQFGGRFGGLYLAHDGSYRYIHAWVYSLFVSPAYAALHLVAPGAGEYLSFRIMNIVMLFFPLVLLWRSAPTVLHLLFIGTLLTSPLTPHMQFTTPELFCFSCILVSFIAIRSPRWRTLSPLLIGVAAAQNIPIAFFLPLHLWLSLSEEGISLHALFRHLFTRRLVPYYLAATLLIAMLLYNHLIFGSWNLIAALGQASTGYITARKLLSMVWSPEIGVFWYLPASWLALVIGITRRHVPIVCATALSVIVVAALCSSTGNINSGQLSACRYAVWFLAPLYLLPFIPPHIGTQRESGGAQRPAVTVSLIIIAAIWTHLGTYRFLFGDVFQFYSTQRATPEVAALYRLTHFPDDPEPLVENLTARELRQPYSFAKLYVWNLGEGESLWIIPQRSLLSRPTFRVTADTDLSSDHALTEVFTITPDADGAFTLVPREGITFERSPYWGRYRLVWVAGTISAIAGSSAVYVR